MKICDWMRSAKEQLTDNERPHRDLEILLERVTGKPRAWLIAFYDSPLTPYMLNTLQQLVARRAAGEPIAYLTGEREFWSLPLKVTPDVMIPRQDTEILVEEALKYLSKTTNNSILDLGTGNGAIALAIASERKDCHILGVDCIDSIIKLAKQNALNLGITNVSFILGKWFSTIKKHKFSMIVSNPPYIDKTDNHLLTGDLRFEPKNALISENNGLADITFIIQEAKKHLTPGGWLLLEHGWNQATIIQKLMSIHKFSKIKTSQDYGGNDRVTSGKSH
ncbi:peptide chain release factor N(5)-glutamine methyltransferase [Candidatus Erwinia haradaeae]|uniref:Release factor glutamine methyltransferase n=1 Tax=Candidatus Erwinia haradaeae TaxID=1922217 RepID=A0A451D2K5_9GAMM|nr:peptide chain release factor N(5)-glutamine methyltransferase [Candidatus Erwinia haradaeae]VFP79871.1 Release factor glutamine methyltransferase [Candidatus Erwinia haradaeae]